MGTDQDLKGAENLRERVGDLEHRLIELVDERSQIERALRDRDVLLHLIVDSVPALVCYVDTDLRYRLASRSYNEWYGLAPDDMIGRRVVDVVGESIFSAIGRIAVCRAAIVSSRLPPHAATRLRLMLIDDEPRVRRSLARLLRKSFDVSAEPGFRPGAALRRPMDGAVLELAPHPERGL